MILFPFFSSFFPPFSRGGRGFLLWSWCPELRETRGGARVAFFSLQTRGGNRYVRHICAKHGGEKGFLCPFFGGVFGSSVPLLILDGWASEKEGSRRNESRGTWRRRRSRGHKEEQKKKKEEEEEEEEEEERRKRRGRRIRRRRIRRTRRRRIRRTRRRRKKIKGRKEGKKKEGKKRKQGRKENRERKKGRKGRMEGNEREKEEGKKGRK